MGRRRIRATLGDRWLCRGAAVAVLLAGCGAVETNDPFSSGGASATGGATAPGTSGGGTINEDSADADGDSDAGSRDDGSDGTLPLLDVGAPGTGGSNPDDPQGGCSAVDVLFVLDNSGSMQNEQQRLVQAFPAFIEAMYESLPPATDLHVGVTTTSFCTSGGSHGETMCVPNEPDDEILASYTTPTDGMASGNGYQGRLVESGGQHYFATNTSDPDKWPLTMWFSDAAADVGAEGCAFEFTAAGAAYAAHPANDATNGGFIRDEGTVLVLFLLSDEGDQSPEALAFYHDTIVAKKAACGGDKCIVAGGLIREECIGVDDPRAVIWKFLNLFGEEPVWGPIEGSSADYVEVLAGSLSQIVAQTCDEIEPEG